MTEGPSDKGQEHQENVAEKQGDEVHKHAATEMGTSVVMLSHGHHADNLHRTTITETEGKIPSQNIITALSLKTSISRKNFLC